ncbi:cysteine proteinase [Eremomyces bilateralis CBS 781.70]|uniref:PAN2-PAN3 deadenylation complex catalytic subunit PAN2 n=1 Tax=Eremomyces bilateralis CBS 781.70 TaxID=1392243 RepID=A0A6G1G5S8_9PEZI|nr:cysteine proteinase [Eremomyces bilateralis CBS 781.70]KAF1813417.1 cysteine proteinase [Eremomyces bilateralis CBS 781.70]
MEADADEVALIALPSPSRLGNVASPVSTVTFDTSQELLWAGNEFGRVTSFYGSELQRYTSFRAHAPPEPAVKQILINDKGVLSISKKSIHFSTRRGLTLWHLKDEAFVDLRCMSFTTKGTSEVLAGGCQDTMFRIDTEKGTITQKISAEGRYTIMKRGGQYICAATESGTVHLLDSTQFRVVKTWQAHVGWINDMDAKADFLVTCGYSPRQQHGYLLDPLANVFDLKTLMPLPPIPFQPGAAFVRMHPRMSTTSIVASQSGQLQVVDIMNPNTVNLRQVNLYDSYLLALEMAPSGEALALIDSASAIHLWGSPAKIHFAELSNPTEFADQSMPLPHLDWSPDSPLNTIGMPYYREPLLSSWPSHMTFEVGAPPPKLDPDVVANLKRAELGGYAPNPRKTRRNQVENTRLAEQTTTSLAAPKFLSEKAREAIALGEDIKKTEDALELLHDLSFDKSGGTEIPVIYKSVEIKYSKFGVDDFDFEFFNKTKYSGLEIHIANSYANALLQLYKFTPILRNMALQHTATSCLYENCLLCELGFLIDMLEKAAGQNCQATNFLKTFSSLSSASSLSLLEEQNNGATTASMVQSLNRFLLDKLASDFRQHSNAPHMDSALVTAAMARIRCAACNNEVTRPGATYVHELIYPTKAAPKANPRAPVPRPTFSQILKASVERQDHSRGWCNECKRYQQLSTRKAIQSVPAVMMINTAIRSADAKQMWSTPNWLPQEIGVIVDQGQFFCYEGGDLNFHLGRKMFNITVYELVGVVTEINTGEHQKPHLVSLVNVAPSSRDANEQSEWHLFNDFLVKGMPREEALRFDSNWKLPCVVTYQVKSASHKIDDAWKQKLDLSLLFKRWSPRQDDDPNKFRLLSPESESPFPGMPVAIDAEFVRVQDEEFSVKAGGIRETIRPARLALGRVSVLRGYGEHEGLPFVDDYIAVAEPVTDYLTAYSGLSPEDLDPKTSRHVLVSLKVAYKKIWLLLNMGCIFVGHGLPKDFRTINIHVPKAQVVDTVDIFFLKHWGGRKLGLRFLAWLLLKEDIQTGMHDSVEDSLTALNLWKKYQEYVEAGTWENRLEWIYQRGRELGWKAPGVYSGKSLGDTPGPSGGQTPVKKPTPFGLNDLGFGSPKRS